MKCMVHSEEEANNLFDDAIRLHYEAKNAESNQILLHLCDGHLDQLDEVEIRFYLGITYYYLKKVILSLKNFSVVLDFLWDKREDLFLLQSLDYIACIKHELERYQESIEYFNKAEELLDLYTIPKWSATRQIFYLRKGRCYLYLGEFNKALEAFLLSKLQLDPIRSDSDDAFNQNLLSYELWRAFVYMKDVENSKETFADINVDLLDESHIDAFNFTLLMYYSLIADYESLIRHFKDYERLGISEFDIFRVHMMVSKAYLELRDGKNTRKFANSVIGGTRDDSDIHLEAREVLKRVNL